MNSRVYWEWQRGPEKGCRDEVEAHPKRKPSKQRAEGLGRVGRTDFAPSVRIPLYYAGAGR